jgi:myosin V
LFFRYFRTYVSECSNLQTDLEETKAQEIAKLQETLHDMQLQVEEAKALVVNEREAARKAIEEAPPVIKETPVLVEDTEKINSLTAEVEQLKVLLQLNHFCMFMWLFFNELSPTF